MEREQTYHDLKVLESAIAKKDVFPALQYIWFDGKRAIAGNDKGYGITVACNLDGFKGGIKGALLLGMLKASKSKEVNVKTVDGKTMVTMGRAKINISTMPLSGKLVVIPEATKTTELTAQFLGALGRVMISVGNPTAAKAEQAGVTLIRDDKILNVFSTDDVTMAWAVCPTKDAPAIESRVILPIQFVETLLEISKGKKTKMSLTDKGAYAETDTASVFAQIIDTDDPTDLLAIGKEASNKTAMVPVPARLKYALQRAAVILDKQKEDIIELQVKDNVLVVKASSPEGSLKDTIEIDGKHPDITCILNPKHLKKGLDKFDRMFIKQSAMIMQGNDTVYMISGR